MISSDYYFMIWPNRWSPLATMDVMTTKVLKFPVNEQEKERERERRQT